MSSPGDRYIAECEEWRQGDIFDYPQLCVIDDAGGIQWHPTPNGAALISQTCDAVIKERPSVQLAPVVLLEGASARDARAGKRPRFAQVPGLEGQFFVDLDCVATISKLQLVGVQRRAGVISDDQIRRFAGAVARKFGRFAFPDSVVGALQPLKKLIESKAPKEASPFGMALNDVAELRVASSSGWQHPPYEVVLIFVLEPGVIPMFPGDQFPEEPPAAFRSGFCDENGRVCRSPTEIADALAGEGLSGEERYWLWEWLAESAADMCVKSAIELDQIGSISSEVVDADYFPLTRVRRTEILDLEHLSPPLPKNL